MGICDANGRDCIEKEYSRTFHCNTTCAGIYADVQWVGEKIDGELEDEEVDEGIGAVFDGKKIDDDVLKVFLLAKTEIMKKMKNEMKLLKDEMKNDIGRVMKIATGERGEELDKEKYRILVSEYRKFKTKNVKHFRFNSAANLSTFGESLFF